MGNLDVTINDTWRNRELNLGDLTYIEYLKSDHWKELKKKAISRPNYQKCEFCNSEKIELHHTSYKYILTKFELRNIISVCRYHHQEIHDYSNDKKVSVRIATNHLRKKYSPEYWIKNRI
jgi:hypothetical protein